MTDGQLRYQTYLQSPHWQKTRARILKRAREHCERCRYFTGDVEVLPFEELLARLDELQEEPWHASPPDGTTGMIHLMPPSVDRGDKRSITPEGFARAVFAANGSSASREAIA